LHGEYWFKLSHKISTIVFRLLQGNWVQMRSLPTYILHLEVFQLLQCASRFTATKISRPVPKVPVARPKASKLQHELCADSQWDA